MTKQRRAREKGNAPGRIPSDGAVLDFLKSAGRPRSLEHIAVALRISGGLRRNELQKRLSGMVRDGRLFLNRREGFGLVQKMGLIVGRIVGHADGFGFLVPDDDAGGDLFLPATEMRSLLHGDRAVARVAGQDRHGRREGALVEVLERANSRIVGRFFREGNTGFVVPDNRRIHQDVLVPSDARGSASTGQFVVAEIVTQPSRHMQPIGRIIEVLGEHAAPGMASEIAIRAFDIPHRWPDGVAGEVAELDPDAVPLLKGRTDLRTLPFVTIDGEDARDFDDAVFCERRGDGWRLLVAIADVSYYVAPGSALDAAARDRGTSVYFPDRVVPMLPEVLSNELCSLKPKVDRLALVCEMSVTAAGQVTRSRFFSAVMRSAARLTYTTVAAAVIEGDPRQRRELAVLIDPLEDLYRLYGVMRRHRSRHALLDFDTTESRIEFDEAGDVRAIRQLVRTDAHRLIEEFMLAANVAAAELLLHRDIPALYRNHDTPKEEKLNDLRGFLADLGLTLGGGSRPATRDYAKLNDTVKHRDDAHLIETLMLRSMPLAVYAAKNIGHFGLAFPAYTHFTSPIRRYPDLLVHRAIRHLIGRRAPYPYDQPEMQRLGEHCSMTERRADEATRDAVQRLKCIFMQDRVAEIFFGRITGVTGFGLFVELDDIFVEGLVHVTSLPNDYYHYDPIRHELRGERRKNRYGLSDRIHVQIMRVDVDDKKIDFGLADAQGDKSRRPGRNAGRAGRRPRRN